MKKMKKFMAVLLALCLVSAGMTATAYGANKKKITTVNLKIKADLHLGDEPDPNNVEVETSSSSYSVDGFQFENDSFVWEENDIPKLRVTLTADEDYYFAMTSASSVTLNGAGAKYVSASKSNSSQNLDIIMTLTPMKEQAGNVASAQWTGNGQASWTAAPGAESYELRLIRNGKAFGSTWEVQGTSCDMTYRLVRSGTYTFRVRSINKNNTQNRGEWVESGSISVDEGQAAMYRQTGGAKWVQDETGWWYQNGDGSYTANNWQNINGKWYFFNEQGYMKTGWILWNNQWYYCNPDGDMAVSATTPDGYVVDENGVLQQ